MNQTTSKGGSKLWVIIFIIALIEFAYIVFATPPPQPSNVNIEGKVEEFLSNIAAPVTASTPEKVIVFPVDAQDGTGRVISKTGDYEQIINVSIPYYYDPKALDVLKETAIINNVCYIEQKGREAQKPTKSDEEIISLLNSSPDVENNLFSLEKGGIYSSQDQKYIVIPVKFKIYNTGLFKFNLSGKLEKATLAISSGEEKLKIANGFFTVDKNNPVKSSLVEKWNRFSQNFYIQVMDATKPEQEAVKPPAVQVYPK